MILTGHLIQSAYLLILSGIAVSIAVSGRRDPAVRDCTSCHRRGCELCGWSGETDSEVSA
ncbi:hypothetical protein [Nocardia sp. NPDC050793]|uniref:hypothetical protein n=1 Tax=Nocardia sp. NPDC050793 TaxID=3155159 RepID=UPI00340A3B46